MKKVTTGNLREVAKSFALPSGVQFFEGRERDRFQSALLRTLAYTKVALYTPQKTSASVDRKFLTGCIVHIQASRLQDGSRP